MAKAEAWRQGMGLDEILPVPDIRRGDAQEPQEDHLAESVWGHAGNLAAGGLLQKSDTRRQIHP